MPDFLFADISSQNINANTAVIQTSGRDTLGLGAWRYICDSMATAALQAAHPRFVAKSSNNRYFRALPEDGRIAVEVGGAKGDGASDDGPAIRATHAYVSAIGARGVSHSAARYRTEKLPAADFPLGGNPAAQVLAAGGTLQTGDGAEFTRQGGGRGILFHPGASGGIIDLPLGADVVAGSRQIQLAAGGGASLAVGDCVLWQLGELPYDPVETPDWDFARVEGVSGDFVTLDKPMPASLTLAAVAGANKRLRKLIPLRDQTIRDLKLTGPLEDGISIYCGQRVRIENVGGRNIGAGLIVAQYCDGVSVSDSWQDGCLLTQASFGAAFSFAECRNIVLTRPRARGTLSLVKLEAGAEATVIGGHFENTLASASGQPFGSQIVAINAVGRASVTVHDLTVTGFGGYRLLEVSNGVAGYEGSALFSGTLRLTHPTAPFSLPLGAIAGTLDMTIGGVREIYHFARLRHWRRRFTLRDGEYHYAFGPAGLLVRARAYASPGMTIGAGQQLTGLWVGRSSDNGTNIADGPSKQLEPGKDVAIPCYGGLVAGAQWTWRNEQLALLCTTAPNAGLNAANQFVEFEGWFAEQADLDLTLSEANFRSAGNERDPFEALFLAYDLPALAAGASSTVDLAIPAMTANDFIAAVRFTGGFGGLELRGVEARAGAVRLTIVNPTATTIDRTPSDVGIAFFKPAVGT